MIERFWSRRFRHPKVGVLLLCLALATIALAAGRPSLGNWCELAPDSFDYLETARSLADTGGFPDRHVVRPPGFPMLLAMLMQLDGPLPLAAARLCFAVCWSLAGILTYWLHRRELGESAAWLAGAFVATSPVLLRQSAVLLSEPLYIPLSLAALGLLAAVAAGRSRACRYVLPAALLTSAALVTRSIGLVILPLAAYAILRGPGRSWRRRLLLLAVFGVIATAPWALWQLRQAPYREGAGYFRLWAAARQAEETDATGVALQAERFCKYAPLRLESIKAAVLPERLLWRAHQDPWGRPTTWLVGGFFVAVALVRLLRKRCLLAAYTLASLLLLAFWPWDEKVRLLTPLIPLLAGQLAWAGLSLWRWNRPRRWLRPALVLATLGLAVMQIAELHLSQQGMAKLRLKSEQRMACMRQTAQHLAEHTPPRAAWLGILPDGHPDKVLLLGAAYFAERPLTLIDVRGEQAADFRRGDDACVLVHRALPASTVRVDAMRRDETLSLCGFDVYVP